MAVFLFLDGFGVLLIAYFVVIRTLDLGSASGGVISETEVRLSAVPKTHTISGRPLLPRAGSPRYINVCRAGSPRYVYVPRAGNPGR